MTSFLSNSFESNFFKACITVLAGSVLILFISQYTNQEVGRYYPYKEDVCIKCFDCIRFMLLHKILNRNFNLLDTHKFQRNRFYDS